MNKINWNNDVESYDIELSLFVEALTRAEDKLKVSQFGEVEKPNLPF